MAYKENITPRRKSLESEEVRTTCLISEENNIRTLKMLESDNSDVTPAETLASGSSAVRAEIGTSLRSVISTKVYNNTAVIICGVCLTQICSFRVF